MVLIPGARRISSIEIPEISWSLNQLDFETYFQRPEYGEGIKCFRNLTDSES